MRSSNRHAPVPASMTWRVAEDRARTAGSKMFRRQDPVDGTLWLLVLAGAALVFAAIFLR